MDPILIGFIILAVLGISIPLLYAVFHRKLQAKLAGGWVLDDYSTNVKAQVKDGKFSFDFPNAYPGVHNLSKDVKGLKLGSSISMTYNITGKDPVFVADGDTPKVSFIITAGMIYSKDPYSAPLKLGQNTLIVPLRPEAWETIDGKACDQDAAQIRNFEKAVTEALTVGPCFGDNHGIAHGVNLTKDGGSAHFQLISFSP